jgi:SPX domain protein involved in polyphosphate accumulation
VEREALRQKIQELFVYFNGLLEYLELNYAGFRKIIKKHDKMTLNNLKVRSRVACVLGWGYGLGGGCEQPQGCVC